MEKMKKIKIGHIAQRLVSVGSYYYPRSSEQWNLGEAIS